MLGTYDNHDSNTRGAAEKLILNCCVLDLLNQLQRTTSDAVGEGANF